MPKFLMGSIVLLLLLGAGYGITTLQARSVPWDCSDWQAFAHADRTTSILESLAENRGKTLYCGVDQSDTFTKAETWEAGKDRNERDDTVYFGERGQFRGFIAAQEGYLTDGESGVTGVSIDRIFEFPREERRRTKRVKRWDISSGPLATDTCPDPEDGRTPGTLACSGWGPGIGSEHGSWATSQRRARNLYVGNDETTSGWRINWETQAFTGARSGFASPDNAGWLELATARAKEVCRAQHGGQSVSNVAFGRGHNRVIGNTDHNNLDFTGEHLGWFHDNLSTQGNQKHRARQSRSWTATCKKTIRRTRK